MSQRFEGRNLEEALQNAATVLGVDRYRLKYRVLTEKRGFLGGVKRLVIEAEIGPDSQVETGAVSAPTSPAASLDRMGSGNRRPERGRRERSRSGGDRTRGDRSSRGGNRDRDERPRRRYVEAPEQGERTEFARGVAEWFNELAALAEFDLTVRTSETDQALTVSLFGRDANLFVDRHGELLDAVQTLVTKAFRDSEKSIDVDALDFKKERAEELEERAHRIADQVRRDGQEQTLPAMSPGERRIIHVALADDADVTTESRGDGYFKKVTILPRRAATSAEA